MSPPLTQAEKEAVDYGIDLNLLFLNLELTLEEKVKQHQRALDIINELKKNCVGSNGIPQKSS